MYFALMHIVTSPSLKCQMLELCFKLRDWKMLHFEWRTSSLVAAIMLVQTSCLPNVMCTKQKSYVQIFKSLFFIFFLKFHEGFVLYESSNCSFDLHSQKNHDKSKKFLTKPKLSSKSNHCCATTNFHPEENCTIKPWATHPKLGNASPPQGACLAARSMPSSCTLRVFSTSSVHCLASPPSPPMNLIRWTKSETI